MTACLERGNHLYYGINKLLAFVKFSGKTLRWIHFDRAGTNRHIVDVDSEGLIRQERLTKENRKIPMADWICDAECQILVLDDVNKNIYTEMVTNLDSWHTIRKEANGEATGFLTMSNKIQQLHDHELGEAVPEDHYRYFTVHSWTLAEFLEAFVEGDGSESDLFTENKALFSQEWSINKRDRDSNGELKGLSITEIVTQKYFTTGGCARWMLGLTTRKTEEAIQKSISEAGDVIGILDFNLGSRNSQAKTHLYFSTATTTSVTYSIVSERATQMLVENGGEGAIKMLYAQARKLNNPAFLGWVVEADYFHRCERDNLMQKKKGATHPSRYPCPTSPHVFDCSQLESLASGDIDGFKVIVGDLLPSETGNPTVCKPKAWNQGGYDVVRIEKGPDYICEVSSKAQATYHLLFGQVTKSRTLSLNLKYFKQFAAFIYTSGHQVASIEIGFIVPSGARVLDEFKIAQNKVFSAGNLVPFLVYGGGGKKWTQNKERNLVTVCELDTSGVNHPNV